MAKSRKAQSVKIHVLRAFRFTQPPDTVLTNGQPRERVFTVGEHEIPLAMAEHPWMAAPNYADGCIETPQAALKRTREAQAKLDEARALAETAKMQAQAAVARLKRTEPARAQAAQFTDAELNTPIGVLRARQDGAAKSA